MKTKILIGIIVVMTIVLGAGGYIFFKGKKENVKGTTQGVSESEVYIGSSAALSGQASFLGNQYTHGSLAYINKVNEGGGVHGRKITLINYDDQYDPSTTLANTQRLVSENRVFALFDYVGTPTTVRIIDFVHQTKVPLLGILSGAEALHTPYRPYIFNIRDSYYDEAEDAVAYFVDKLGFKKIAVMYQEDDFGLTVLSGVQLALERRNMDTVATATYIRGTMDVEKAAGIIKQSEAEAVVLVGTYGPLAKFIKISQQAGFKPYFHTVSFVGSEAFAKELIEIQKVDPAEYKKIIVTQVVPSPFSEEFSGVKEYAELAKKYYPNDEPNFTALEGFINAKVLVKALEDTGPDLTREKFIETLESMQNVDLGIGKRLSFGTLNHGGLRGVYYSRIAEGGKFEIFQP